MARKLIRVSRRMLFTWFMLAGLIFLFAPQRLTNKFQSAFARIFCWPLTIGRNISLSAHTERQLTNVVSRREYNKLQNQFRNHTENLTEALIQGRQEFEKLYGLYNRYVLDGVEFALADVIRVSIDKSHCELTISCGKKNGLAKGQFVLGDNSIIGTISEVDSRLGIARVRLITDPASKIAVKISGLNVSGIMQGNGNNSARLLQTKYEAQVGDSVYAIKKPEFLDAAMKIGKVIQCETNDEEPLLWDITVEPACDIKQLKDVAVIIMNP